MEQEFLSYEELDSMKKMCEWDKRRECDSLYRNQYNKIAIKLHNVIEYIKLNDTLDKEILLKMLTK